jgi:hypothetical protein
VNRILLAAILLAVLPLRAQEASPIADNSFLIEEAYNQEAGVVQHIQLFTRSASDAWAYSFTQEWPVRSIRHQLSYTLPLAAEPGARGTGDVAVHYRYQLAGADGGRLAIAPRISIQLPTGDEHRGLGAGSVTWQTMLPVSFQLAPRLVSHSNLGATFGTGDSRAWTAGQSLVWLAHPRINPLVEAVWTRNDAHGAHDSDTVISPGIRWSYNFASGLQVVPGIAMPVSLHDHERTLLLYLSFEHPFRRAH